MADISVCVMAKNEQDFLPHLLGGVPPSVELIVLDTGSSDATGSLALKYGARLLHHRTDDLSEARNVLMSAAERTWIFFLDADEIVTGEDWQRLLNFISDAKADSYFLPFRTYVGGGRWSVIPYLRLLRRDVNARWEFAFHETILPSLRASGAEIGYLDVAIRHLEYLSPEGLLAKRERNISRTRALAVDDGSTEYAELESIVALDLYASDLKQQSRETIEKCVDLEPTNSFVGAMYGHILRADGEYQAAIDVYERALATCLRDNAPGGVIAGLLAFSIEAYLFMDDLDSATDAVARMLDIDRTPESLVNAATVAALGDRLDEAVLFAEEAYVSDSFLGDRRAWGREATHSIYALEANVVSQFESVARNSRLFSVFFR